MSSSQNERTLREMGGGVGSKMNKDEQEGEQGSKLGYLERTYFLNVLLGNV